MVENPRAREAQQEKNRTGTPNGPAEAVEGRGMVEGNSLQDDTSRMQGRTDVPQALERVRQAATKDKGLRFTALFHHVYSIEALWNAYLALKREAAPGVDGVTWEEYGERLEENLYDLAGRLKRGAYRVKPGRRVYIPKADGKQRPLGVIALEDKLVQRATTQVLNAVYETDFLGFSYGFRPERGQHDALDAEGPGRAGRGQTGNVRFPRLHAYLSQDAKRGTVHGAATDHPEATDGKTGGSEGGAEAAHARAYIPNGRVAESGGEGTLRVLRGAHEPPGALPFPV